MKAYSERKGLAPFSLNLVNTGPSCFSPEKEPRFRLNRRLGGPKNCSGRFRRRKKYFPYWVRSPDRPSYVGQKLWR